MRRSRTLALTAAIAGLVALLAGCSPSAGSVEVGADTVIVDVRTPEEFAQGHLEGAVNVDLQSGAFEDEIGEYPVDGEYLVYCRIGNRSGQAVAIMESMGCDDVHNIGGVEDSSSATGIPIVTD
ncbi:hypothetical protein GCM10022200_07690 [Microbacterium awajiense]|uniref:Rhodanese domain-containing protein n=1 Tax=Microbacterium awajiense TaxID=415214 RepID=A0ABP7A9P8_9MICO